MKKIKNSYDPISFQERKRILKNVTIASVLVSALLVIIKLIAWSATDSVSILSSLVDSSFDAIASLVNLFAVRHALVPADKNHRFGHGKAEALSGIAQSMFIFGSVVFLLIEVFSRFFFPKPIDHSFFGIIIILISLVLTFLLVLYQKSVIKKTKSTAIKADSLHYLSDILLNFGVILSLIISSFFSIWFADPLFALIISVYILSVTYRIFISSLDELMDKEFSEEDRVKIIKTVLDHELVKDIHDLRTRKSGYSAFIQFHLDLSPSLSLLEAHKISDEVESKLLYYFPGSEIIIHQDPEGIDEQRDSFD